MIDTVVLDNLVDATNKAYIFHINANNTISSGVYVLLYFVIIESITSCVESTILFAESITA